MVIGRPDVATLGCDGPLARRGRPQVRQGCASPWRGGGGALPRGEEEERTTWASKPAEPPREPRGERGPQATLWRRIPAGGGGTKAWVSQPTAPPGSGNRGSVPLPHCPPSPAAAIAAATMPKRKKQNQQQPPPPPPQPARWDRDEPGDDDDDEEEEGEEESPIGPPSLLGPPPMANGKPGDPKSALHRGPPGSRGPMIPPLLSLPPPLRGRGPIRGGLGPRCSPYGHGWWGVNPEPPFPRPGYGGPFRESFHTEPRNPQRFKSWSLTKTIYPPKDGPHMIEDKSDRPVCRHFSKKGHCRYEDLCAFYHPGVNGPPL